MRCQIGGKHSGLGCRILLASGFDPGQHTHSDQHNPSDNDPVRRHVYQDRAIDQPDGQDGEAGDVDRE